MPSLSHVLANSKHRLIQGKLPEEIKGLAFDSRAVREGYVFVAIKGTQADGHDFLAKAVENGATALIVEQEPANLQIATDKEVAIVKVSDSAKALGQMASLFYGEPSKQFKLVGVTGTNGKTSVATMLYELFMKLGYATGLFSTVHNLIGEEVQEATHTTPDPIQLNEQMAKMVAKGITHCFMEVSSHAIHQQRIAGLDFDGAIFTNISRDHLDYHKTFENYISAKQLFFTGLKASAFGLSNLDDKRGKVMLEASKAKHYFYALKMPADFKAKLLSNTVEGLELEIDGKLGHYLLKGSFNAYNLTAVYGAAMLLEEPQEEVLVELSSIKPPLGRFQTVHLSDRKVGIVDYAHTPDALLNVLETIHEIRTGNEKVITVVGCGGDRDTGKRPEMGQIAAQYSDLAFFTADNPRSEDPLTIIQEMQKGVQASDFRKVRIEPDRKTAIESAVEEAKAGDIILLAGKGHEEYQVMATEKVPFSDLKTLLDTQTKSTA